MPWIRPRAVRISRTVNSVLLWMRMEKVWQTMRGRLWLTKMVARQLQRVSKTQVDRKLPPTPVRREKWVKWTVG
jgi:hypothetical protein